jgi:hypothetical protein
MVIAENEAGIDTVISFDHIAVADSKVIACDMTHK